MSPAGVAGPEVIIGPLPAKLVLGGLPPGMTELGLEIVVVVNPER